MAKGRKVVNIPSVSNGGLLKARDFFGFWSPNGGSYPMINGNRLHSGNLKTYLLYVRYSDKNVDIYTRTPKGRDIFIAHDKNTGKVDWFEGLASGIKYYQQLASE